MLGIVAVAVLSGAMLAAAAHLLRARWKTLADWLRWPCAAALGAVSLTWLLCAYAFLIEPEMLVVRRVEIVSADWRGAPLTIAAISDTHVGDPHVDAARMARVVRRINSLHADLVVLLGDYVARHAPAAARSPAENQDILGAIATAAAVNARYGVVAVIGNDDSWYGREIVTTALQNAGVAALWNRNITIRRAGGEIVVAGLADAWTGYPNFADALDGAPAGADTIVLSHNPDPFAHIPAGPALMLAGHTHCGQVTIPFVGRPYLPIHHREFACGRFDRGGQTLYVTAGIGTSIVPARFLNPPEIALITIRSGSQGFAPAPA
ncbi:MAG: metallophosphoesterase family protein [Proteobacteria bacterium]|nr:metallophosphoesterase family protein [Pseudomonadota bacterium]